MFPNTFEIFEFNKMWFVFGISLIIFFLWSTKIILLKKLAIQRTPLDAPIILFLLSQIISTIISIDPYTSIWGYYGRFNGSLLSVISYIFLYYAFTTNLASTDSEKKPISYSLLTISLLSGLVVTLWGLPSHFGYDPTCLLFRGALDVKCWTEQFQPTIRVFSTLGQPNWLAAYLSALIPVSLAMGISNFSAKGRAAVSGKFLIYFLVSILYFLSLLWTRSQSGFLGLAIGLLIFFVLFFFYEFGRQASFHKLLKEWGVRFTLGIILIFAAITFINGAPIEQLNKFASFKGISERFSKKPQEVVKKHQQPTSEIDTGVTDSSKIRLIVWRGALELAKQNPILGTGVETFAYAYYRVKPVEHNLTSEWDFLYNKAHNEYLNYLATTGAFGLLSYLAMIGWFLIISIKYLTRLASRNYVILASLVASYISILVVNFFGFSVVVVNLFLFLIPAFFFSLAANKYLSKSLAFSLLPKSDIPKKPSSWQMATIIVIGILALYGEFYLLNFWIADQKYALGYNLNKAQEYTSAYSHLLDATNLLPQEDLYKDELSINLATLALAYYQQDQATSAAQFANLSEQLSNGVIGRHPNNITYYKTRTRIGFLLAQIDPLYLSLALNAVQKSYQLAPTDAKILYNMALIYGQKGDTKKALEILSETIKLKPNYLDAYYAQALFYNQLAKEEPGRASEYKQKAKEALTRILTSDPKNTNVQELLRSL